MNQSQDNKISNYYSILKSKIRRDIILKLGEYKEEGLQFEDLRNRLRFELEKTNFQRQIEPLRTKNIIEKIGPKRNDPFRLTEEGLILFEILLNNSKYWNIESFPKLRYSYFFELRLEEKYVNQVIKLILNNQWKMKESTNKNVNTVIKSTNILQKSTFIYLEFERYKGNCEIKCNIELSSSLNKIIDAKNELRYIILNNFGKLVNYIKNILIQIIIDLRFIYINLNLKNLDIIDNEIKDIIEKTISKSDFIID